jgi:hypothetical protein
MFWSRQAVIQINRRRIIGRKQRSEQRHTHKQNQQRHADDSKWLSTNREREK